MIELMLRFRTIDNERYAVIEVAGIFGLFMTRRACPTAFLYDHGHNYAMDYSDQPELILSFIRDAAASGLFDRDILNDQYVLKLRDLVADRALLEE